MTLYATEAQRFGLKKEASRGTAESAPAKWYPTRGLPSIDYGLKLLKDEGIRGIGQEYPPIAGIKEGEAKIPMNLDPQACVEMFYSLLGSVSSAQQGVTAAYTHTITQSSDISKIAYTLFLDRSLNVMKYNGAVVKKIALKGGVDNLIDMDVDAIFRTEASGSIGSPSFPTQRYLGFQNVTFNIAGSQDTNVKEWTLSIDNGAKGLRTMAGSQDISDVIVPGRLNVEGSFTVYFANTTERDKFLANTSVALEILAQGAVIASTYHYAVDINIYQAHYTAFPYGEEDGLLAAKVSYKGHYDSSATKTIQVDVTNTDTSY